MIGLWGADSSQGATPDKSVSDFVFFRNTIFQVILVCRTSQRVSVTQRRACKSACLRLGIALQQIELDWTTMKK